MKTHYIEATLRDHLSSICEVHPAIKDDLENHSFIAGGAITSMMLGEKVNDFDFYFDSLDVVKRIISYFVTAAGLEEGRRGEQAVGKVVMHIGDFTNINQEVEQRVVFEHSDGIHLPNSNAKFHPRFFTDNAITLTNKTQMIVRFYGTPDQVFRNYDFIHCTAHWSLEGGLHIPKLALQSMLTKELYYQGSLYPLCSVLRTRKFIRRGWKISAGQMMKMLFQMRLIDFRDRATLRDQIMGVDMLYMNVFLRRLDSSVDGDGRPDLSLISQYLDEAFGEDDFEHST
jgi:hypothetical protein